MLDASALLALMLDEFGAEDVRLMLPRANISAVNLSEVVAKLHEREVPDAIIESLVAELDLRITPFDRSQAMRAGLLRTATKHAGLSLGDRACLAAAAASNAVAVTTDRTWSSLSLEVNVECVR